MPGQEEQSLEEDNHPRFPWRELGLWVKYWRAKLWDEVQSLWERLKSIPPYRRKTYLAIVGMVALLLIGGTVLGSLIGSVGIGILFVSVVTTVWLAIIYFKGNSILPLLAGAKPVKEEKHPELVSIVRELAQAAELPMPSFWIADDPEPNAFTCGRDSNHAAIVIFTGGLKLWKDEEVKGILAHEMAHIKNKDILLDTFMRAIVNGMLWSAILFMKPIEWSVRLLSSFSSASEEGGIISGVLAFIALGLSLFWRALDFLFGVVLLPATQLLQMAASRQQEYFADALGAQLAGSPRGLASALAKLQVVERASPSARHQGMRGPKGTMELLWSTHPPTEERIRRLGGIPFAAGSPEEEKVLKELETGEEAREPRPERSSVPPNITHAAKQETGYEKGGGMKYKVVPVDVAVLEEQGPGEVAEQVETIINNEAARGWEFVSIENIEIAVTNPGSKGCFGIGAKPETSRITRFDMAVFRQ